MAQDGGDNSGASTLQVGCPRVPLLSVVVGATPYVGPRVAEMDCGGGVSAAMMLMPEVAATVPYSGATHVPTAYLSPVDIHYRSARTTSGMCNNACQPRSRKRTNVAHRVSGEKYVLGFTCGRARGSVPVGRGSIRDRHVFTCLHDFTSVYAAYVGMIIVVHAFRRFVEVGRGGQRVSCTLQGQCAISGRLSQWSTASPPYLSVPLICLSVPQLCRTVAAQHSTSVSSAVQIQTPTAAASAAWAPYVSV